MSPCPHPPFGCGATCFCYPYISIKIYPFSQKLFQNHQSVPQDRKAVEENNEMLHISYVQRNASHLLRLNFTSLNSFSTLTKEHHAGNRKAVEAVAKHKCFAMEKIFLRKFLPVSSINTKHSSVAKQPRSVLNIKFFVQLS